MMPTTSNSKDGSNNRTAYKNRNASNSRNESNSRIANREGMPTTAGMIAKVMKPATACREENININTINMRWQQQQSRTQQHSLGTPATAAETSLF
jgi:hypothetical protein